MKDRFIFLHTALDCIDRIERYTANLSYQEFLDETKTQDAVIRNLEVIGQTIKDFGVENLNKGYPNTPWNQIAGMRNIIAHEYLGVDLHLVWQTINTELKLLKSDLKKIVNNHSQ